MKAARGAKLAGAAALSLFLAACGGSDQPELMNVRKSGDGPDEFAILPPKPLQMPETLAALPAPTPGGANLTDPTPEADAVLALGGTPGAGPSDAALVAHAGRMGQTADIRGVLAAEDLEYRRDNDGRLLERLLGVNVYYSAYDPMSLNQKAELERWRRRGLATPSAPPEPIEE